MGAARNASPLIRTQIARSHLPQHWRSVVTTFSWHDFLRTCNHLNVVSSSHFQVSPDLTKFVAKSFPTSFC